jgi:NAD(P)-dependent dehydrogenase (short-subunit alcohol dehydrogenase family)
VVNNTGHATKGKLLDIADADWHSGLDLLLLNVARGAPRTPPMRACKRGAIVNIRRTPRSSPTCASRSARRCARPRQFAKLYVTPAPNGIRMNNLLPGSWTRTASTARSAIRSRARYGTPGEIAAHRGLPAVGRRRHVTARTCVSTAV